MLTQILICFHRINFFRTCFSILEIPGYIGNRLNPLFHFFYEIFDRNTKLNAKGLPQMTYMVLFP